MDNHQHQQQEQELHQQQQQVPFAQNNSHHKNEQFNAESKAVSAFLKVVNDGIRGNGSVNPMSEKTALKFLISRKFDIARAIQLYQMHEITRLREGLTDIDPSEETLKAELESGKFTILKYRDANDSAIAIFTAKLHAPCTSSKNQALRRMTHRTTLQGIVYQLDSALENIVTQKNGVVFIYNMIDSDYSNFDYELCQKILNLLKGAYPAKLKKVLIVSPPLWFRAPFTLLRLIVREKLRDRVWLLSIGQLLEHVPTDALTTDLGGTYLHDHLEWLSECNILYKNRHNDLCDPASARSLTKAFSNNPNDLKRSSQDISSVLEGLEMEASQERDLKVKSKSPAYDYDDTGYPLNKLIERLKKIGPSGLEEEYEEIKSCERTGTFMVSSSPMNMKKNRYINIKCYDHTRVVLEPYDLQSVHNFGDPMDYINANYVDGYRQSKAYISTQGPNEHTLIDFWRMVWQTGCRVIVMVTLNVENLMIKCDKYWPSSDDRKFVAGVYTLEYSSVEKNEDFVITNLKLTNTRSEVSRDISHLQFISWPDFGTPETANALLKFRESVLKRQLDALELTGGVIYPPIVVHCSAGVGRSGTFITIDTCIQKLETTGLVDVKSVVEKLREQRYLSIQTKAQYIFCYKSVLEYAASCKLLDPNALDGLFEQ